jgi:hypothetical protein
MREQQQLQVADPRLRESKCPQSEGNFLRQHQEGRSPSKAFQLAGESDILINYIESYMSSKINSQFHKHKNK